jgi:hypothetical protein
VKSSHKYSFIHTLGLLVALQAASFLAAAFTFEIVSALTAAFDLIAGLRLATDAFDCQTLQWLT